MCRQGLRQGRIRPKPRRTMFRRLLLSLPGDIMPKIGQSRIARRFSQCSADLQHGRPPRRVRRPPGCQHAGVTVLDLRRRAPRARWPLAAGCYWAGGAGLGPGRRRFCRAAWRGEIRGACAAARILRCPPCRQRPNAVADLRFSARSMTAARNCRACALKAGQLETRAPCSPTCGCRLLPAISSRLARGRKMPGAGSPALAVSYIWTAKTRDWYREQP